MAKTTKFFAFCHMLQLKSNLSERRVKVYPMVYTNFGNFEFGISTRKDSLFIGVIIIVCFCGCNAGVTTSSDSDQEWAVFNSLLFNYSLEYPSAWQPIEYKDGNKGVEEIIAIIGQQPFFQPAIVAYRQDPKTQKTMPITKFGEQRLEAISLSYQLGNMETKYLEDGSELIVQELTFSNGPTFQGYIIYLPRQEGNLIFIIRTFSSNYGQSTEIVFERIINSISNMAREQNLS